MIIVVIVVMNKISNDWNKFFQELLGGYEESDFESFFTALWSTFKGKYLHKQVKWLKVNFVWIFSFEAIGGDFYQLQCGWQHHHFTYQWQNFQVVLIDPNTVAPR